MLNNLMNWLMLDAGHHMVAAGLRVWSADYALGSVGH